MWVCERCGVGDGLCVYCRGGVMNWKTYFYGADGFVLEKEIYGLDVNGEHKTYTLRTWSRMGSTHLQAVDRQFVLVTAFFINKQHIAYYEEII